MSVNWDLINEMYENPYVYNLLWMPYDKENIISARHTIFDPDVDVAPKWDIPDKIALAVAVTGGMYSNKDNPNHPMTDEEIYQSARECCLAGAPLVHVHVRNEHGFSVFNYEQYKSILGRLKDEFPDVFFDSCLVAGENEVYEQMLRLLEEGYVEATPVNCNALLYGDTMFCKPPHFMMKKAKDLQDRGIKPFLGIYTDGDVANADRYLIKTGILQKPYCFGIVPCVQGCIPMNNPRSMIEGFTTTVNNIRDVAPDALISVCAGGRASSYIGTLAIIMGLGVRVGMEDTPWMWPHKDDYIKNNAQEFIRYRTLCEILGREIMTADEYRKHIGLKK